MDFYYSFKNDIISKRSFDMSKPETILNYYIVCHKLKNTIRTGWKKWGVSAERLESVAEHVYGTQMLALAIYSEYDYDIDILKVIFMLAIHEIGEAAIGDFTPFEIDRSEKERLEHEAVHKILQGLKNSDEIEQYFLEFDAQQTLEAKFAYQCDKIEAELQCKIYDEQESVDIYNLPDNEVTLNSGIQKALQTCNSWSETFIDYDNYLVSYDDNFRAISEYVKNSKIAKN